MRSHYLKAINLLLRSAWIGFWSIVSAIFPSQALQRLDLRCVEVHSSKYAPAIVLPMLIIRKAGDEASNSCNVEPHLQLQIQSTEKNCGFVFVFSA